MEEEKKTRRRHTEQPVDLITYPNAMLRVQTVATICGVGASTIWRLVKAGQFPKPHLLKNPAGTRWRAGDVDAYLRNRFEQA